MLKAFLFLTFVCLTSTLHSTESETLKTADHNALLKALQTSETTSTRLAITDKITNQRMLIEISKTDTSALVRCAAVRKITNEKSLIDILHNDNDEEVRLTAASGITNQNTLINLYNNEKSINIKWAIVKNITIQSKLEKIAESETEDRTVREAAIINVNSQEILTRIALNDKSDLLRWTAVQRVLDKNSLQNVIERDLSKSVRSAAKKALANLPE